MKRMRVLLTCLSIGLGIATFTGGAGAQTVPAQGNATTVPSNEYPPGYMALIMDLEGIEMRMTMEQKSGKGGHWPQWLRAGMVEGNSLYWWMLAKWHHNAGNRDLAYRSLLTAWVLTRMEDRSCLSRKDQTSTRLLRMHQDVLGAGTTENKITQESVFYALSMTESFIKNEIPIRGMACNIEPAKKALEDQRKQLEMWKAEAEKAVREGRMAPTWKPKRSEQLIDFRAGRTQEEQAKYLDMQKKEHERVSQELQSDRARKQLDIDTVIRTMDEAEKAR